MLTVKSADVPAAPAPSSSASTWIAVPAGTSRGADMLTMRRGVGLAAIVTVATGRSAAIVSPGYRSPMTIAAAESDVICGTMSCDAPSTATSCARTRSASRRGWLRGDNREARAAGAGRFHGGIDDRGDRNRHRDRPQERGGEAGADCGHRAPTPRERSINRSANAPPSAGASGESDAGAPANERFASEAAAVAASTSAAWRRAGSSAASAARCSRSPPAQRLRRRIDADRLLGQDGACCRTVHRPCRPRSEPRSRAADPAAAPFGGSPAHRRRRAAPAAGSARLPVRRRAGSSWLRVASARRM